MQVPSCLTAPQYKATWSVCLQVLPLAVFLPPHTLQVPPSRLTECLHQFIVSCTNGEHSNGCFQSRYTCVVCVWRCVLTTTSSLGWRVILSEDCPLCTHTHTQWSSFSGQPTGTTASYPLQPSVLGLCPLHPRPLLSRTNAPQGFSLPRCYYVASGGHSDCQPAGEGADMCTFLAKNNSWWLCSLVTEAT